MTTFSLFESVISLAGDAGLVGWTCSWLVGAGLEDLVEASATFSVLKQCVCKSIRYQ